MIMVLKMAGNFNWHDWLPWLQCSVYRQSNNNVKFMYHFWCLPYGAFSFITRRPHTQVAFCHGHCVCCVLWNMCHPERCFRLALCAVLKNVPFWNMLQICTVQASSYRSRMLNARSWSILTCARRPKSKTKLLHLFLCLSVCLLFFFFFCFCFCFVFFVLFVLFCFSVMNVGLNAMS